MTRSTCWAAALVLLAGGVSASAGPKGEAAAGRCVAVEGALLARAGDGPWKAIAAGADIPAGVELISLFDSTFQSANKAVEVRLPADVGHHGPFPVQESAVSVHAAPGHDLGLGIERGLMVLRNLKKQGSATLELKLRDMKVNMKMLEPGTEVGLEAFGRLAPGEPKLSKDDVPVVFIYLIVLKGEVELSNEAKTMRLHAPPGPALMQWDSLFKTPEVTRLEKLPDTAHPDTPEEIKGLAELCARAKPLAKGDASFLEEALKSKNPAERKTAVTMLGALDDLPRLIGVLAASPHADTRDQAVLVARNWLGRQPGQTAKLAEVLQKDKGLTVPQVKAGLHLLLGFEEEKRRDPDLYAMLISYLEHSKAPVRHLAHWHLVRLVPAGRDIPFDALAAVDERQRSIERWRALIPEGKLPPAPKKSAP